MAKEPLAINRNYLISSVNNYDPCVGTLLDKHLPEKDIIPATEVTNTLKGIVVMSGKECPSEIVNKLNDSGEGRAFWDCLIQDYVPFCRGVIQQ